MAPVPDQSPSTAQAVLNLEAGLAALKQGDYATAIATLTSIPLPTDHPLAAKAQMGLAVAYARTGNPLQAAALCRSLERSENPQVSAWATRTLAGLVERHPQLAEQSKAAEFQEAETQQYEAQENATEVSPRLSTANVDADLTGFTPFDPAAPPDFKSTVDRSGFVAFDSPPPSVAPSASAALDPTTPDPMREATVQAPVAHNPVFSPSEAALPSPGVTAQPSSANRRSPAQPSTQTPALNRSTLDPADTTADAQLPLYQPFWRQAGRLRQGKALGKVMWLPQLLVQGGTAVSLFWMVQTIAYTVMLYYSILLTEIPFLEWRRTLFDPPVFPILLFLGLLCVASRWLLDGLLTVGYGLQPLSLSKLATYSPETAQSLQRFCRQKNLPMPALGVLPIAAPVAFTYGCLPRVARTVVSQGLLEQLADDEIATVYASEIGHLSCWDVPLMSLVIVLLQIPYTGYWVVAEWGNRKQAALSRASATLLAAIFYGVYTLLRWVALWLSRQRVYDSDRITAELTGNPNGFTRALLKIAIGTVKDVQTQKQTRYLLEGFDLLMPLGQRMATTLGSVYPHASIESVLDWERVNPYRHWLALNHSHPPTGDRLQRLTLYARQWRLETELDWANSQPVVNRLAALKLTGRQWRTLLLQGAPFFGLAGGFAIAYFFAGLGWVGAQANIEQLSWMNGDQTLRHGLPLIGFSLGTFVRINAFFPDLPFSNASLSNAQRSSSSASLVDRLQMTEQIPVAFQPVQWEGKLLGRPGMSNFLSQDLLLQTATGIVRLHCLSPWGPIGNLLPQPTRPTDLLNQTVVVTGWFRRGTTPWIDVDTLRTAGGRISRSGHPLWSTLLGAIAAVWGIYIIFSGGFSDTGF